MQKSNQATLEVSLASLSLGIPDLLLPSPSINLETWAVVACDQYTSDQEYWSSVESLCEGKPSTLHITLPEIYLKSPELNQKIDSIVKTMEEYQKNGTLIPGGQGFVYIERFTHSGLRQGLLVSVDLEAYDYSPGSKTPIRATEGTIVDRIPPRLRVRSGASLELPHIMILIDDPDYGVIEALASQKSKLKPLYDFSLNKDGGTLKGWLVSDHDDLLGLSKKLLALKDTIAQKQGTTTPLFYAMGDGNHSLATAKANWELIKAKELAEGKSLEMVMKHPARYALAELVNIHSKGLRFEPIHRAIFTSQALEYFHILETNPAVESVTPCTESEIREILEKPGLGQRSLGVFWGKDWYKVIIKESSALLPTALADLVFETLQSKDAKADIDFIHGWQDTVRLVSEGAVAVMVPVISRDQLFPWVQSHGPLPRKSFSMGDAEEKRYYFEARRISL